MNEEDYGETPHSDGDYDIDAPPYKKPLEGYKDAEFAEYNEQVREAFLDDGGADDKQNSSNQNQSDGGKRKNKEDEKTAQKSKKLKT